MQIFQGIIIWNANIHQVNCKLFQHAYFCFNALVDVISRCHKKKRDTPKAADKDKSKTKLSLLGSFSCTESIQKSQKDQPRWLKMYQENECDRNQLIYKKEIGKIPFNYRKISLNFEGLPAPP
jgi:hypothetical protein